MVFIDERCFINVRNGFLELELHLFAGNNTDSIENNTIDFNKDRNSVDDNQKQKC